MALIINGRILYIDNSVKFGAFEKLRKDIGIGGDKGGSGLEQRIIAAENKIDILLKDVEIKECPATMPARLRGLNMIIIIMRSSFAIIRFGTAH